MLIWLIIALEMVTVSTLNEKRIEQLPDHVLVEVLKQECEWLTTRNNK